MTAGDVIWTGAEYEAVEVAKVQIGSIPITSRTAIFRRRADVFDELVLEPLPTHICGRHPGGCGTLGTAAP